MNYYYIIIEDHRNTEAEMEWDNKSRITSGHQKLGKQNKTKQNKTKQNKTKQKNKEVSLLKHHRDSSLPDTMMFISKPQNSERTMIATSHAACGHFLQQQ